MAEPWMHFTFKLYTQCILNIDVVNYVTEKTAPTADLCADFADLFAPWSEHTSKPPPKITAAGVLACDNSTRGHVFLEVKPSQSRADLAADVAAQLRMMFRKYVLIAKFPRFRRVFCIKAVHAKAG